MITADHGGDPSDVSTDHTREFVPMVAAGPRVRPGVDVGTRATFADLGATVAEHLGVPPLARRELPLRDPAGVTRGRPPAAARASVY